MTTGAYLGARWLACGHLLVTSMSTGGRPEGLLSTIRDHRSPHPIHKALTDRCSFTPCSPSGRMGRWPRHR